MRTALKERFLRKLRSEVTKSVSELFYIFK